MAQGEDSDGERVAILTTLGCKFCRAIKAELKQAGIAFQDIDLSRQLEVLRKAKQITGQSTVPQVFVGGKLIGGAEATKKLLDEANCSGGSRRRVGGLYQPSCSGWCRMHRQEYRSWRKNCCRKE